MLQRRRTFTSNNHTLLRQQNVGLVQILHILYFYFISGEDGEALSITNTLLLPGGFVILVSATSINRRQQHSARNTTDNVLHRLSHTTPCQRCWRRCSAKHSDKQTSNLGRKTWL
jgi:hypothetical protein